MTLKIESTMVSRTKGETINYTYYEDDPTKNLDGKKLVSVQAYCFCGDKMVVVYTEKKKSWSTPGGKIESGETIEEATAREVREETNMDVVFQKIIGYIDFYEKDKITRQTRSFCLVEPLGDFTSDPDDDITEIKLIDPEDHKKHFNWGIVGDHVMKKAIELKKEQEKSN